MRRRLLLVLLIVLPFVATACQKKTAGPSVSDYQKQRAELMEKYKKGDAKGGQQLVGGKPGGKAAQQGESMEPIMGSAEGYFYDPIGKRDPFRSFILDRIVERDPNAKGPLEQFELAQLDVTGVVWEGNGRRALVLDPSGQAYIVSEGDRIGKNDGRVLEIGDSRMLVKEAYVDFHGEKTTKEIEMRIRHSQGG